MKYLVAFALIAVAAALPEPVRLLDPVQLQEPVYAPIDIAPLMVPQEVMDEIAMSVKVVDAPEIAGAAEDVNAYAVNFVEEAANAEAAPALEVAEDANAYAVNFVEEAINAEAAPTIEASEDVSAYAVNFIEESVNAELGAPITIQVMDIPLPGSVVLPLADLVQLPFVDPAVVADSPMESSDAGFSVKIVDVADVDEETPSFMPIKQYPDPRWR